MNSMFENIYIRHHDKKLKEHKVKTIVTTLTVLHPNKVTNILTQ